ncbi:MAG: MFS transporter, partial [Caldilineaceae bacterium]|nr:MFS transporter [Caldilineaceae bacterium]
MTLQPTLSKRWAVPFFTLWGGQALSLLGSRVAGFALVWWLTEQTGSAVVLSTMTLMFFLPQILLGPFAGALIDRWDRRWVMLVADSTTALASALLAVLFWTDSLQVWHIYTTSFIGSLAGAFHFAAMMASTSLMVPEHQLTRVQGANQMLQGLMTIAAPPVGALLVGFLPFAAIMGLDVVTALFAVVPLLLIAIPRPQGSAEREQVAGATPAAIWRDVRSGFRYIWEWPGLLLTTLLALVINMVATPLGALLPILVSVDFEAGALQLGWIELTLGAGMLAGGILLGVWGGFRKKALIFPIGVFGFAFASFLIAVSPQLALWVAMLAMGIFGIVSSLLNGT